MAVSSVSRFIVFVGSILVRMVRPVSLSIRPFTCVLPVFVIGLFSVPCVAAHLFSHVGVHLRVKRASSGMSVPLLLLVSGAYHLFEISGRLLSDPLVRSSCVVPTLFFLFFACVAIIALPCLCVFLLFLCFSFCVSFGFRGLQYIFLSG